MCGVTSMSIPKLRHRALARLNTASHAAIGIGSPPSVSHSASGSILPEHEARTLVGFQQVIADGDGWPNSSKTQRSMIVVGNHQRRVDAFPCLPLPITTQRNVPFDLSIIVQALQQPQRQPDFAALAALRRGSGKPVW
jgi:hypothetical protein